MATIPRQGQVGVNPAGPVQGQFANRSTAVVEGAFGGGVAKAIGQLGEAGQNIATAGTREVVREQALENETTATEAATAYSRATNDELAQFSALQGGAATAAYPQFVERMRSMEQDAIAGADNPAVRRMLQGRIAAQGTAVLSSAGRWNVQQGRVASVQASESAATNSVNEGVLYRADPQRMGLALSQGLGEIHKIGEVQGWDDETLRMQQAAYRGRFYSGVIGSVADTDPLAAQRLFEQNRDGMDAPSQLRVENALSGPVRARRAADIVASVTQPIAPDAPASEVRSRAFRAENPAGGDERNPGSTARGPGQITDGTWRAYAPRLGLTDAQRNDRGAHEKIWDAYQADAQQQIGRPLVPGEQYAAWVLGIAGAKAFIMAGPAADARETYRGVAGDEIANKAFASNGNLMRPGMTVGQVMNALGARIGAVSPTQDRSAMLGEVVRRAGPDPQLQTAAMAQFNQWANLQDAMQSQERAGMDRRVQDLGRALETGAANVSIPEADIRRLYQPEQADRILDGLYTQQIAGNMFQSVQLATPEQIAEMRTDLNSGTGPLSGVLRARRGTVLSADGTVAEADRAGDVAARSELGRLLDARLAARQQMLSSDPVQYVTADPAVRTAVQAISAAQPGDTAPFGAYVTAVTAAQARLGVPEGDRRVLSKAQSESIAGNLMNADPATEKPAEKMAQLALTYGENWPRVFHDLVRDGKLPPDYQVLGVIPSPVGQADYQRMMQAARLAGGMDKLRETVPRATRQQIEQQSEEYTSAFVQTATAGQQTGGAVLASVVHRSVENLAMYYALHGMAPADAMKQAADRVINDRYDFQGTMRVPKGMLPDVQRAQGIVMRGLSPENLAPMPGNPELNDEERRGIAYRNAQRGFWVPNKRDDGLILMMELHNGGRVPVMRDSGHVEILFDSLPTEPVTAARPIERQDAMARGVNRIEGFGDDPQPTARPASPGTAPSTPPVTDTLPTRRRGQWRRPPQ